MYEIIGEYEWFLVVLCATSCSREPRHLRVAAHITTASTTTKPWRCRRRRRQCARVVASQTPNHTTTPLGCPDAKRFMRVHDCTCSNVR